jgi:hypothetical protein
MYVVAHDNNYGGDGPDGRGVGVPPPDERSRDETGGGSSPAAQGAADAGAADAGPGPVGSVFNLFALPRGEVALDEADVAALARVSPARVRRRIVLQFPRPEAEAQSDPDALAASEGLDGAPREVLEAPMRLVVGCCAAAGSKTGGNGSFELRVEEQARIEGSDEEFFACSKTSGSVSAGTECEVAFTFTKPAEDDNEETGLLKVGQWLEQTYVCSLSGGYVPEGEPDTEEVEIVVRAFAVM